MKRRPRRRPHGVRAARAPALVLLLLGLAGCDSATDSEPQGSILGTWVATDLGVTAYLDITESTLIQYVGNEDRCFEILAFDIVGSSGDTYTLRDRDDDETYQIVIVREGDQLRVGTAGQSFLYSATDVDPSGLEECVLPDDPSISCTALPEVQVGTAVEGTLSETDPIFGFDGPYFDLYGLQLEAPTAVRIDLRSEAFDALLVVYDAGGELVDFNDDGEPQLLDAWLELELVDGCYRILATSSNTGETGAYTLSVE